ncbi:MAG TPA: type II toxin-antitoxin system VapC family toxin [Abditibacteriaceae bacterium]
MSPQAYVAFDASAALAFALNDEPLHTQAVALVADLVKRRMRLCAPPLFESEADSVIRRRVHLGTLTEAEAATTRQILAALSTQITYDIATKDRAYAIAVQYNQPRAYDATYAAFAEARHIELWTADERFYNSVNGSTVKQRLTFVQFVGAFKPTTVNKK